MENKKDMHLRMIYACDEILRGHLFQLILSVGCMPFEKKQKRIEYREPNNINPSTELIKQKTELLYSRFIDSV